ncbi:MULTISPECIES: FUSC family protein [unclassified Luteococcus]|uniref:FUSC family protein n=1 Tax=unclassified Luteococcus TaxID=2639923 RepID=UPI00313D96C0
MDVTPGRAAARLHEVTLRAFDLSESAARMGLAEQRRRVDRWRQRLFMICQISVAAGLAWFLGQHVLRHEMPFFASVAAIICLGFSFGQRLSRVVEVACGVFIGVMTGDLFVSLFGTGPLQIMLVCFVAMSVATWFNAKPLMINQSGIQAATVMTLMPAPHQGLSRWEDALLGCSLALLFATVAPTSPVQKPRVKAAEVLEHCAATLRQAGEGLAELDAAVGERVLERARGTQAKLTQLSDAASEGVAVTRYSPFLRGHRGHAQAIAELVAPLDRLVRNLRVLARRAAIATWREEPVPFDYLALVDELADVVDFCAQELSARRIPERARPRIIALAERSGRVGLHGPLSGLVIFAQVRSMLVDLLELTGMDYADARALVPEAD